MNIAEDIRRFGHHRNAFGFLRLLLASLVIVSHTPELVDNDQHRELLTRLVGTTTFGGLAVAGFFIVSGFLIAGSFQSSRGMADYLVKRVARIYPGFAIASLVCVVVIGPIAGGHLMTGVVQSLVGIFARIAILSPPTLRGALANTPVPLLNGAAWTIQYEFACYLLVVALGVTGLLRRGAGLAIVATVLLLLAPLLSSRPDDAAFLPGHSILLVASPRDLARLPGMFLTGVAFRAFQHRLTVSARASAVAAAGLVATLLVPALAYFGTALFGGYLLFAAARAGADGPLSRINDRDDISYGLYLYAWPIEQLLLTVGLRRSLWVLGGATWLLAAAAGWLSWKLVEKPALRLIPRRGQAGEATAS